MEHLPPDLPPEDAADPVKLADWFAKVKLRYAELAEHAEERANRAEASERNERQRADGESRRAEEERQRRKEETRRADEGNRRAEENNALIQLSTLEELLEECHKHLALRFQIQPDPKKCTRGEMTRPEGKKCPNVLRPWASFLQEQQEAFDTAYDALHPIATPQRVFRPRLFYQEQGKTFNNKFLSSEADLRSFQYLAVETFVEDILKALKKDVTFEYNSRPLDRNDEEVVARDAERRSATTVPDPKYADRYCIYTRVDGSEQLILVLEYKAPHKLTKEYVRAALKNPDGLDVHEVADGEKTGNTSRQKYLLKARRLVAAAATQTYHYMLEGGCRYGCVVTGEVMIFLQVKEQKHERTTLYFHVAEPTREVLSDDGSLAFPHFKTAIAQLMSFCLMATESTQRPQEWREGAMAEAKDWTMNYGQLFLEIPKDLRELRGDINDEEYSEDTKYPGRKDVIPARSPYFMRKRPASKITAGCNTTIQTLREDDDDEPDDDSWCGQAEESPTKLAVNKKVASQKSAVKQEDKTASSSSRQGQKTKYCTQACLLGLDRAHPIDPSCPNADLHPRSTKDGNKHAITKQQLCTLLRQQLARTRDEDCTDLKLGGARGMLFKLTLQSHGYTFVGKGTIDVFIPDLRHEGKIYGNLRSLQGKSTPVYLGNIDLQVPWYDIGIHIVHMLLLSYGGTPVITEYPGLDGHIKDFTQALERRGITHRDMELRNMLWNEELGTTIFIDFERSSLASVKKKEREPLQDLSPNQNRRTKRGTKDHKGKIGLSGKSTLLFPEVHRSQDDYKVPDFFESLDEDGGERTAHVAKLLDGLLLSTSPVKKNFGVVYSLEHAES